ncbi:conjugal transfer protein TraG N-terminal domain-containing protein [Sphingomonas sp. BK069]|uniref:conjugal transfer protein TraG N-terminal domain-containing protein n=1 Tax=Sphingomonas sp. BK069 TaxID=2586979 RepID=UPI00162187EF|nr:conjugal transfer protein TraG N-terminal domain-containing protein [Sphingomonas sp. BK069]MBB3350029.1 conjugal transfer mating pair stabilization protein TraG [Sphingomonas sp. BK069]
MVEVFTIGGGEYIVNTFNAVAAWTGGGGYRALLRVVMILGLIYTLMSVAFTMNWRVWMNWFLGSTLIYSCLMVPTVSVKVTDRINPSLAPATIANVPLGLGVMASFTSQVGDWLTRTAETVFTMPSQLNYSTNGMVYGARLFDATRNFEIRDAEFATNLSAHFKSCVFGDIMLGQKSMTDLANAKDLWVAMGPGSVARSQPWVTREGIAVTTDIIICNNAYEKLSGQWQSMIAANTPIWSKQAYPKLSTSVASAKLRADVPIVNQAFTAASPNFEAVMRQNTAINAFMQARDGMAGGPGAASIDTFATTRADIQARNTYNSIAQQAMSWVPILNIVLTVVFYAMFPVIFPLFLMPQTGVGALKGYLTGFFYLASWGPLYVILHMICMTRATIAAKGVAEGGISLGTYAGIGAVNAETATIAGFMLMSVPFLAAGLAKGAMSISGQATSVLNPAQNAAEAAAAEQTTGNYSYGNTSFASSTSNMRQSNQWHDNPAFSSGAGSFSFLRDNGASLNSFGDGHTKYDTSKAISSLPYNASTVQTAMATESRQAVMAARIADGFEQASRTETQHLEALRNGHTWSSGTTTAFGSSVGGRGGSTTSVTDARSIRQGASVEAREASGAGTRHNYEEGQNYNSSGQWFAGGSMGVSFGGSGGGKSGAGAEGEKAPKAPGKGGVVGAVIGALGGKAEANAGYNRTWTNSDVTSDTSDTNQSHDKTIAATGSTGSDHNVGTSIGHQDGSFYQTDKSVRSEQGEARTRAIEESLSKIQSYNEQARHYRELSQSLERHASFSESNGFNLSQDLRQDLATWYDNEAAHAPKGTMPGLWQTDLDTAREGLRNAAIGKWANERSGRIERDIQAALDNPALAGLQVPEVGSASDVKGRYRGGSIGTAHPVALDRPDDTPVRDAVTAGAVEIGLDQRRLQNVATADFAQAPKGAARE